MTEPLNFGDIRPLGDEPAKASPSFRDLNRARFGGGAYDAEKVRAFQDGVAQGEQDGTYTSRAAFQKIMDDVIRRQQEQAFGYTVYDEPARDYPDLDALRRAWDQCFNPFGQQAPPQGHRTYTYGASSDSSNFTFDFRFDFRTAQPQQPLLPVDVQEAYSALDLQPVASPEESRSRYRQLARERHPDRGGSTEAMQALNRAYDRIQQWQKEHI